MTADDYADPAFEQWNNAFNACQNLYDDDELEECVNATEQDLDDRGTPRGRGGLVLVDDGGRGQHGLEWCAAGGCPDGRARHGRPEPGVEQQPGATADHQDRGGEPDGHGSRSVLDEPMRARD